MNESMGENEPITDLPLGGLQQTGMQADKR
jgi:hypothetical protein